MGVGAVENREIGILSTVSNTVHDGSGDKSRFIALAVAGMYRDVVALRVLCPERFALSQIVVGNDCVGGVQNILCAAVVLFETDDLGALEGVFKGEDIFNGSAAEFVDALVVVADYTDIAVLLGEHRNKLILHLVGVLILVDHDIFELVLIKAENLRLLTEQLYRVAEKVVKIHRVRGFELCLIDFIDFRDRACAEIILLVFQQILRFEHFVLGARNFREYRTRLKYMLVELQLLDDILDQSLLIIGGIDGEM